MVDIFGLFISTHVCPYKSISESTSESGSLAEQAIVVAFTELRSCESMRQEWDENKDENCFVSLKTAMVLKMFEADTRLSLSLTGGNCI